MTQIQLRRDTAANWSSTNPVLASGEPAYETDTGKFKIGDGVTAYNSLDYMGAGDLPDNVTTQGNTFNGASQLVQLDSTGKLPAIDGSQLTNLPAGSAPSNMVTTDTAQTISANKTLNAKLIISNTSNTGIYNGYNGTPVLCMTGSNQITLGHTNKSKQCFVVIANGLNTFKIEPNVEGAFINYKKIATVEDIPDTSSFATKSSVDTISSALNGLKFWKGSQTDYNAIEAKDENTLYIITG